MEHDPITPISYYSGAALFAALILVNGYLWRIKSVHFSLIIASLVSVIWSMAIGINSAQLTLGLPNLLVLEAARFGAWILAILGCLKFASGQRLPQPLQLTINGLWISTLLASIALSTTNSPWIDNSDVLIWVSLILAITALVSVEQLYRNTLQSRHVKLLAVAIGSIFVYDIYLFSHALIFNQIDQGLWQARGAVNGSAALIMAIGSLAIASQQQQHARLAVSRPIVFYTTSLTAAGGFLTLMAIGGYYVQLYGGRWGSVVQIILLFLAILSIVIVFVSKTIQSRLNVWINKNFFRHKYDYRLEWLRLINSLSQPTNAGEFHQRAITTVASIFKSPGGALWLRDNNSFRPVSAMGLQLPATDLVVEADSPFCQAMQNSEWVFSPKAPEDHTLSQSNELLPPWIFTIPDLWLTLPLLTESELLGFMVLVEPKLDTSLTWEDLDLLKTVGRQIASYLERHEAARRLAESAQFDAFNKLTAFIMHDLKNLIAQQALVVANAAKHKENPAFVEDAIRTIDNSVGRMSNLLKKLQHNEPAEFRSLDLQRVLMDAVKRCQENKPAPALRLQASDMRVNADPDRLLMTLIHIIKNAQEATPHDGFVDVILRREDSSAVIEVEDNGSGMEADFLANRLFKPFVTTKSGKGMGIGVYQTKEYVSSLGGSVRVSSTPGEGTLFTIQLPLHQ